MTTSFSVRVLGATTTAVLLLYGCSSWRASQAPEEQSRLPVMESMPVDSSKVDTTTLPLGEPKDPDTVLPPP
jgi:hypothetical protein